MGVLNRTPDSFYDAGRYFAFDEFLAKADGAGGRGRRPARRRRREGRVRAKRCPSEEELERVVPAVEALRGRFDVPISVDTWRSGVLDAALEGGRLRGQRHQRLRRSRLPRRRRPSRRVGRGHPHPPGAPRGRSGAGLPGGRRRHGRGLLRRAGCSAPRRPASRASGSSSTPASTSARRSPCPSSCCGRPTAWPRSATRCSCRPPTSASWARSSAWTWPIARLASVAAHAPGHRPGLPGAAGARREGEPAGGRRHGGDPGCATEPASRRRRPARRTGG